MFGGHKDDSLLLGLHHVPEQVQEHGRLVIQPQVEEGELGEEGIVTQSRTHSIKSHNFKYTHRAFILMLPVNIFWNILQCTTYRCAHLLTHLLT